MKGKLLGIVLILCLAALVFAQEPVNSQRTTNHKAEITVSNPVLRDIFDFSARPVMADVCDESGRMWRFEVDTNGTIVSFSSHFNGRFSEGVVKTRFADYVWGYVDTTGKVVIAPQFLGVGDFSEGRAPVFVEKSNSIKLIDKTGKIVSDWMEAPTAMLSAMELAYKTGEELNVLKPSGLELKDAPDIGAKTLVVVPYGKYVSIGEDKNGLFPFEVEGITGHWVLAGYEEFKGYIFDGYLSRLPAPPEDCNSLEEYVDEKLAAADKRVNIQINPWDSGVYWALQLQKCRLGAVLRIDLGFEDSRETLEIPNISLTEGFLIAKLCTDRLFENEVLPRGQDQIEMFKDGYDGIQKFNVTVKKKQNNYIEISIAAGY